MNMGSALYPERELWFAQSVIPALGTTGSAVDLSNIVQHRGSFLIVAPPSLGAAVTVTFETANGDPATNYCTPINSWSALNGGGLCDDPAALSVVIDPADPAYSATLGLIARLPIQCRSQFVRAKISAATAGLSVLVIGKASRLFSV